MDTIGTTVSHVVLYCIWRSPYVGQLKCALVSVRDFRRGRATVSCKKEVVVFLGLFLNRGLTVLYIREYCIIQM